jgi:6-phosphogluconolactonase
MTPRSTIKAAGMILTSGALLMLSACGGGVGGSSATYTVGGKVTGLTGSGLVLSNNGGDNLTVTANGAFTFATALPQGRTYSVTASAQPTNPDQNCGVRNGTGSGDIGNADITTVAVVCINVGRFAYVPNAVSNTISAYSINATSGALIAVAGSPFPAATFPSVITLHPSGNFAYVTHDTNNISAYAIDASTGALSTVAGSPYGTGTSPWAVTIDAMGKFAYVANQTSDDVSAYTIDATTGVLTAVAGSPYPSGDYPYDAVIDPNSRFLYVTNYGIPAVGTWSGGSISAYTINASTGALMPVAGSPFPVGSCPCAITVDAGGKFAYVVSGGDGTVRTYTIDANTGALGPVASIAGGFCPGIPGQGADCRVTIDPSGRFAYVSTQGGGVGVYGVLAFTIDPTTGALTAAGKPSAAGTEPRFITINPTGTFAYVADRYSGNVYAFTINDSTGMLTAAGSPLAAGMEPSSVELDPSGKFAYIADAAASNNSQAYPIEAYSIDGSTGALTAVPGSPFLAGVFGGLPPPQVVVLN